MNNRSDLLNQISKDLNIIRGNQETESDWAKRIIYSSIGKQAIASLWDRDQEDTSIIRFKRRIVELYSAWEKIVTDVYSEIKIEPSDFADEIFEILENNGFLYHSPNRVTAAPEKVIRRKKITFYRTAYVNHLRPISGLGAYTKTENTIIDDYSMIGIENHTLEEIYNHERSSITFRDMKSLEGAQFLKITPPFSKGYWKNEPDHTEEISIMRIGDEGQYLYFYYTYDNESLKVSSIPNWKANNGEYRRLANALLYKNHTLPPINYSNDGSVIMIKQNYLLPPAELDFLILYSWPKKYWKDHSHFERVMSSEVFEEFREMLVNKGFSFAEV